MVGGSDDSGLTSDSDVNSEGEIEEEEMKEIMEQMDRELKAAGFKSSVVESESDVELAQNLLTSLAAQPEAAGPTSNILHSLGIPVPDPD